MSAFDITLLSLYRVNGQEWPHLPGLLAQNPPKRAARGREQDQLLVYLTLAGNVSFSSTDYSQITSQVAQTFYETSGSLTFALKSAVEAINTFLTERNMQTTSKGQYSLGALVLAALRGNLLYIVQSGPTHAFTLSAEPRHLHDPQLAGKGLGLSQTAHMYFAQAQISPGEKILFSAALPPNWEKAISEGRGPASLDSTRRRLMAANDGNVSALLIQFDSGAGQIKTIQPGKDIQAETDQPAVTTPAVSPALQPASPAPAGGTLPAAAPQPKEQNPALIAPPPAPAQMNAVVTEEKPRPQPVTPPAPQTATRQISTSRAAPNRQPPSSPQPHPLLSPQRKEQAMAQIRTAARAMAQGIGRGRETWDKLSAGVQNFIPRLLPTEEDGEAPGLFSRWWPAFIAVLVPIIIIVIGVTVYTYVGKPREAEYYIAQAQEARQQALTEADPNLQREHWKTVLEKLNQAESTAGITETTRQLRQEAQNAQDALNRVSRVDFKPALSSLLSKNLQIVQVAASDTDIYLLDASRSMVMRGVFNGHNYDLDGSFRCEPGAYNGIQVNALVEIIALPRTNTTTATLLGVDESGNLLYCAPGDAPRASFLQPPDTNWNHITAAAYDAGNLYVLDAPARAVWVYFGDAEINFADKPYFFFESQVPLTLEQAIGLAVNGDDLYLLYNDGHMTTCTLSRLSSAPTRCNDPAIFTDTRPGFQGGIRLADGNFSQIAFTTPPDPSVVLLQQYTQAVFRFSATALELQKVLMDNSDSDPLPPRENITAMAFSPNKSLFVLVGGQLYFAANVP